MDDFADRVLNFWFSNHRWKDLTRPPAKSAPLDPADAPRWFGTSKEFGQEIREKFEDDLSRLMNDLDRHLTDFRHPEYILACIIALDQFPRNIYRRDARAFAFDSKASELSKLCIAQQLDKELPYLERAFAYLPFEHSENLEDQNRSVSYARELYDEAKNDPNLDGNTLGFVKDALEFAEQHRDIIQRFGRFPHRNRVLDRENTEDEKLYLSQIEQTFGQ